MESDQKRALGDKVIRSACTWLDLRNKKNGLRGAAKEAAKDRQRAAECDLAEATEKYQKEN